MLSLVESNLKLAKLFAQHGSTFPEGRGFNFHPGQSFSLSLCGPISISRANAHVVHMR